MPAKVHFHRGGEPADTGRVQAAPRPRRTLRVLSRNPDLRHWGMCIYVFWLHVAWYERPTRRIRRHRKRSKGRNHSAQREHFPPPWGWKAPGFALAAAEALAGGCSAATELTAKATLTNRSMVFWSAAISQRLEFCAEAVLSRALRAQPGWFCCTRVSISPFFRAA